MSMRIHGRWSTTLIGSVLVSHFADNFNLEGAEARFLDAQRTAPSGQPWAALNVSWGGIGTPEVYASFIVQREWMYANGCVCIANVSPDSFRKQVLERHLGTYSADQADYFLTLDQACAWLSQRGFPIQADAIPLPNWTQG